MIWLVLGNFRVARGAGLVARTHIYGPRDLHVLGSVYCINRDDLYAPCLLFSCARRGGRFDLTRTLLSGRVLQFRSGETQVATSM